jgi:hypothetical protein
MKTGTGAFSASDFSVSDFSRDSALLVALARTIRLVGERRNAAIEPVAVAKKIFDPEDIFELSKKKTLKRKCWRKFSKVPESQTTIVEMQISLSNLKIESGVNTNELSTNLEAKIRIRLPVDRNNCERNKNTNHIKHIIDI